MRSLVIMAVLLLTGITNVFADEILVDNIYYTLHSYSNSATASADGGTLGERVTIPKYVTHNGVEYKVTGIEDMGYNPNVKVLNLPNSVMYIGGSYSSNFSILDKMPNLEEINIADGGNNSYFSAGGMIVTKSSGSLSYVPKGLCNADKLVIPEGVKTISYNLSLSFKEVLLPSTFTDCSYLSYISNTEKYTVSENNPLLSARGDEIYSKSGRTLLRKAKSVSSSSVYVLQETVDTLKTRSVTYGKFVVPGNRVLVSTERINSIIYVPSSMLDKYKESPIWQDGKQEGYDAIVDSIMYKFVDDNAYVLFSLADREKVVIPATCSYDSKTYSVKGISERAFYYANCKEVVLPEGLEEIGSEAFYYSKTERINLPSTLKNIGKNALNLKQANTINALGLKPFALEASPFYSYYTTMYVSTAYKSEFEQTSIWKDLKYIAADNVSNGLLYAITSENTVSVIGMVDSATEIDIPSSVVLDGKTYSVTKISDSAFNGKWLTKVTLHEGLEEIGGSAFINNSLAEVTLPSTVKKIGANSFSGQYCDSSRRMSLFMMVKFLSEAAPSVETSSFNYNYSALLVKDDETYNKYKKAKNYSSFTIYPSIDYAVIDDVTYIRKSDGSAVVANIDVKEKEVRTIPSSVKINGVESSVAEIGKLTCSYIGLQLTLPATVTSLDREPSYYAIRLTSEKAPTVSRLNSEYKYLVPAANYDDYANADIWKYNKEKFSPYDGVVADTLFYAINEDGKSVSVNRIVSWESNVVVPETITIGDKQYTVTELGDYAIRTYAGENVMITLPSTIQKIGNYMIECYNSYKCMVSTDGVPTLGSYQSYLYNATLFVKPGKSSDFRYADVWSQFGNIVEASVIDEDFAYTFVRTYYGNSEAIVSAVLSNTQKDFIIPSHVKGKDDNGNDVECPVVGLGVNLFSKNELNNVLLPNTLKYIDNGAFRNETYSYNTFNVNLPRSLETIGDYAFYAADIENIVIPENVNHIGEGAFALSNLKSIKVREGNKYFKSEGYKYIDPYSTYDPYYYCTIGEDNKQLLTTEGKLLFFCQGYYDYYDTFIDANSIDANALYGCNFGTLYLLPNLSSEGLTGETFANVEITKFQIYDRDGYGSQLSTDEDGHGLMAEVDGVKTFIAYAGPNYEEVEYSIPEDVKVIGEYAFAGKRKPTTLIIPESVYRIGTRAFNREEEYYDYSNPIGSLYVYSSYPITDLDYEVFSSNMYQNTALYVPKDLIDSYRYTYPWSNFSSINVINRSINEEDYQLLKKFYEEMGGDYWYTKWNLGMSAGDVTGNLYGVKMNNNRVTQVSLSNNGISGTLTSTLFNLPYIESIDLSNNNISGDIDDVLRDVSNSTLQTLDISSNSISGNIGIVGSALTALQTLNASYNKITEVSPTLPYYLYNVNLYSQSLNMSSKKFSQIVGRNRSVLPTIMTYDVDSRSYSGSLSLSSSSPSWSVKFTTDSKGVLSVSAGNSYYSGSTYKGELSGKATLYGSNSTSLSVDLDFISGDVDFNTFVDVADVQKSINYIFDNSSSVLYNYTAGNLVADGGIDVLDVVSEVNLLLASGESSNARAKRLAFTSAASVSNMSVCAEDDDADGVGEAYEDAIAMQHQARLFWRGGKLIMQTDVPVAAMDITLCGETTAMWMPDAKKYQSQTRHNGSQQRIVHCSIGGYTLDGEMLLADAGAKAMDIESVTLVDRDGNYIPVSIIDNESTAIDDVESQTGNDDSYSIKLNDESIMVIANRQQNNVPWMILSVDGKVYAKGVANMVKGINTIPCPQNAKGNIMIKVGKNYIKVVK